MSTSSSTKEEEIEEQEQEGWKVHFLRGGCLQLLVLFDSIGTLGARDFSCMVSGFGQVLKSDPREKPLAQSAIPFDSAEPITTPLIPKHTESGCFADWFLGDIEYFKCSDWITITIGA